MDKHYTPAYLAERIVKKRLDFTPKLIADFAAGEGALLKAASVRWPAARLVATDLDASALRGLIRGLPNVSVGRCDFMNGSSRKRSRLLSEIRGTVCLAFINPPFSCRGATKHQVTTSDLAIWCSLPMAFVINSVQYLHTGGHVIAILPSSCLTSERDAVGFKVLLDRFSFTRIAKIRPYEFDNCRVEIDVVWLKPHRRRLASNPIASSRQLPPSLSSQTAPVRVVRGQIGMHRWRPATGRSAISLVHTTDLKNNTLIFSGRRTNAKTSVISGPAILLPRVGRPDLRKVCMYFDDGPIAISDCIIALQTNSINSTLSVYNSIFEHWDIVAGQYVGSCAKYLTLVRASRVIGAILGEQSESKVSASIVSAEAGPLNTQRTVFGSGRRRVSYSSLLPTTLGA